MEGPYGRVRRFPRIPAEHAVLVRKVAPEGVEGFVKTRVLGLGGCMFRSDQEIGVGTTLELLLSVDDRVVKAAGEVVYERPAPGGEREVGVAFLHVAKEDLAVILELFPEDAPVLGEGE